MIKMGKLQVNSDISPKNFLILSVFAFILFLIFARYTITNVIKTKDFVKVEATITEVGHHYNAESRSYTNYIKFSYTYDNKTYNNEQRVSTRFDKKVGNLTRIYVNPNMPNEIRDTYNIKISIIASIVTLIINVFLLKAYKIRKNMN